MPRARVVLPMLAAIAVAGSATAAVTAGDGNAPDSGVRGVVLPRFPCPVILESDRCDEQPRSESVLISRARDGKRVATIGTDARGRFHKALEPGTYVFALQRAPAPTAAKRVVVPAHRFVPVILR